MIQELFRIGPLAISPFGVMLVVAFLGGYLQLRWGLRRLGVGDEDDAGAILFAAGVGGIVGSKVYYALLQGDLTLILERSGLVWYGGLVVGALAVLGVIRWRGLPLGATADAVAPAIAIGYGLGRVGCFLVGDDYGRPTELPWGIRYPEGLPPTFAGDLRHHFGVELPPEIPDHQLLAVHPTQIYELLLCVGIWAVGVWLLKRGAMWGTTALTVFGLLAVERFAIEFLRVKDDRFFGDITLAQVLSLAMLGLVIWLAWRRRAAARRVA